MTDLIRKSVSKLSKTKILRSDFFGKMKNFAFAKPHNCVLDQTKVWNKKILYNLKIFAQMLHDPNS